MQKKKIVLWGIALLILGGMLYLGEIISEDEEYIERFFNHTMVTLALVVPALMITVLLSFVIMGLEWLAKVVLKTIQQKNNHFFLLLSKVLVLVISYLPPLLSSIPIFISGIFFIYYYKLDTLNSYNFLYGVLCLATFNVNYFFKRSQQKIQQAYKKTSVLYARSLGLSEKEIFRYYVLPQVICDHLIILRELLPHIIIESIVIEYTFAYSALLKSVVQAILFGSWYYFILFVYVFILLLLAFDAICRFVENYFIPQ